jgi:hypothetical protein
MKSKKTGYWTFFCNPKIWAVDRFLESRPKYDTYQITDWQRNWFDIGQLGLLRVGVDTRSKKMLQNRNRLNPGIYAIIEVVSKPRKRGIANEPFWYQPDPNRANKLIVETRILYNLIDKPITLDILKSNIQIRDEYLINGFQASSMPLDSQSFEQIFSKYPIADYNFNEEKIEIPEDKDSLRNLGEQYKNAVPKVKEVIAKKIERGKFADQIKKQENYECKICKALGLNPFSFTKRNGIPYIEIHHVIPVSEGVQGTLGPQNLITVCANHHRQLHYGNIELIEKDTKFIFLIDGKQVEIKKICL